MPVAQPTEQSWTKDTTPCELQNIRDILEQRKCRYGVFANHAEISQTLKNTMHETPGWLHLSESQRESLEMIAHKIARILNGDPTYSDNWTDIAGYATLVEQELNGEFL